MGPIGAAGAADPEGLARPGGGQDGWGASLAGGARVLSTGRRHGDMNGPGATERRRRVLDRQWTVLRQVHGARVVVVDRPGAAVGIEADAAVSTCEGVALAVLTADCAAVALASPEGVVGIAHAGWRGLLADVVAATVDAMAQLGATRLEAALGPCIRPGCYEFSPGDLERAETWGGPSLRSTARHGAAALDLPAGVRRALGRAGVRLVADASVCTACSTQHWSHRARRDSARQATVVWRP